MNLPQSMLYRTGAVGIALAGLFLLASASVALADETDDREPATDSEITDHVGDELMIDHGVSSWKIDVSTKDGVVTLTGTVNNLLARNRAARIAENVRGVRAVINQIEVAPSTTRTDEQIAADLDKALVADPAADSWKISHTVDKSVVTLTGSVGSFAEKDLARKIASGVHGVTDVSNEIDVEYDTERTDLEVREDVEGRLKWSVLVDHHLIDVSVDDGNVSLSGTVGSAAEKRRARYMAWVAGVESVDSSELTVAPWARDEHRRKKKYVAKKASEIQEAIEDALLYDPRVMSFNVTPEVYGSTVTLRGEVGDFAAKKAAGQVARRTVGVTSVTNRLKVRPEEDILDEELEEDVEAALLRDPYVDRFEITVSVIGSVANLYGTVDSWFEKSQAETVAGNVAGVVEVENYLTVSEESPYTYDPYLDEYDYDYTYTPDVTTGTGAASDAEIEEDIRDELWWSPFVDADQVTVDVENETATLSGAVDSRAERASAAKNAYDGGAVAVINNLKVRGTDE